MQRTCNKHATNMQQTCKPVHADKHATDMRKYATNMQRACNKHATNMQQTCHKYAANMQTEYMQQPHERKLKC